MRFRRALATLLIVLVPLQGCDVPLEFPVAVRAGPGWMAGATDEQYMALGMERFNRLLQPPGTCVGVQVVDGSDPSMEGMWGYTRRCGTGFLIVLSDKSHGEFRLAILAHELAHTLAFPDDMEEIQYPERCGGHGGQFGIEWSRVYRAIWYNQRTPDELAVPAEPPAAPAPPTAGPSIGGTFEGSSTPRGTQ